MRSTLTLKPKPARIGQPKHTPPPADPVKIGLSQALGLRFVSREGRYIMQTRTVLFPTEQHSPNEMTWIDIPLVPEVYG